MQAYILWEKAGKPDGADFASQARRMLQDQLQQGATVEHLEKSLLAPPPPSAAPPKDDGKRQEDVKKQDDSQVSAAHAHHRLVHAMQNI